MVSSKDFHDIQQNRSSKNLIHHFLLHCLISFTEIIQKILVSLNLYLKDKIFRNCIEGVQFECIGMTLPLLLLVEAESRFHRKSLQACNFFLKRLQPKCFSAKFSKYLKNNYFEEHLRATASHLERDGNNLVPSASSCYKKKAKKKRLKFVQIEGIFFSINCGIRRRRD